MTPYAGVLNLKAGTAARQGVLKTVAQKWRETEAMYRAALAGGLQFPPSVARSLGYRFDLGLMLMARGFQMLLSDPPLARALWARALGKVVAVLFK